MAVDRALEDLLDPAHIARILDLMEARGVVAFRVRSGDQELEVRWPETKTSRKPLRDEELDESVEEEPPVLELCAVTSPTVGTYFASPEPGKLPFVQVGDRVSAGQTLCVVESMKLMNEIAADVDGVVEELPVQNGGSVKAGEVVCLLRVVAER